MIVIAVLKIIGIVLTAVLVIALLTVGLLLFVPFKYRLNGSFKEEIPEGSFSFQWLFSFFRIYAFIGKGKEPEAYVSVLGRKVYDLLNGGGSDVSKPERAKTQEGHDTDEKAAPYNDVSVSDRGKSTVYETELDEAASDEGTTDRGSIKEAGLKPFDREENNTGRGAAKGRSQSNDASLSGDAACHGYKDGIKPDDNDLKIHEILEDRGRPGTKEARIDNSGVLSRLIEKGVKLIRDGASKLKHLILHLKDNREKLKALLRLYRDERYADAITLLKKRVSRTLKEILPRQGSGYVRFGSDDPYDTGRVMQIAAVLYPFYAGKVEVIPDFSGACLEGDLSIKGRIRACVLLWTFIRIFFNKKLRQMYKKARRVIEEGKPEKGGQKIDGGFNGQAA